MPALRRLEEEREEPEASRCESSAMSGSPFGGASESEQTASGAGRPADDATGPAGAFAATSHNSRVSINQRGVFTFSYTQLSTYSLPGFTSPFSTLLEDGPW